MVPDELWQWLRLISDSTIKRVTGDRRSSCCCGLCCATLLHVCYRLLQTVYCYTIVGEQQSCATEACNKLIVYHQLNTSLSLVVRQLYMADKTVALMLFTNAISLLNNSARTGFNDLWKVSNA